MRKEDKTPYKVILFSDQFSNRTPNREVNRELSQEKHSTSCSPSDTSLASEVPHKKQAVCYLQTARVVVIEMIRSLHLDRKRYGLPE